MEIDHKFEYVDGNFDTKTGKLRCVSNRKYMRVDLCFEAGNSFVTFAQIRLHGSNLFVDAKEIFDSAAGLGEEICRRWNDNDNPQ